MAKKTKVEVKATPAKSKAKSATKSISKSTPVSPKSTRGSTAASASKKSTAKAAAPTAKSKSATAAKPRATVAPTNKAAAARVSPTASSKGRVSAAVASTKKASSASPVSVTRSVAASVAEKAAKKISAPVKPAAPKEAPVQTAARVSDQQKKSVSQRHGFKTNEYVVYPAHGVGCIIGIEEQEIAGIALELFVINFEKEKLTLRVPTGKLESVGMRKLSDDGIVKRAMEILKGRARVKRTMWSRRAQEYVAKINSGDLVSIAEVVRDLYRSEAQPEQSYSERQLYEDALDRMAREIAAVEKLDERGAVQRITDVLSKSARSRRAAAEEEAADAETRAA
ncbi:CarD family transcriptional regulator [Candidatus Filomicrobium marinum]|uniref:CarD family transcriptional regulator n=1 Tax=Candidatus Filomicrobium marinum TaxID=1608628 RepID=A0A0D6JBP2_9HYPH|nr:MULTISPECIES: CarD family transcriptional regulator [Filomicrobium]MCV0370737.1 CarD family transcriptional regulator [Filomicrobium sp.]CFX05947.1 CarD family transcriptional regulator [Candidatus Filomicrobium marinum]CPR16326.1 CarD family transcriptional regulator [Candidatus Filomicrobium marinum]